jgi:hypothetical protein
LKFQSARICCANIFPTKRPRFCARPMRSAAIGFVCWATRISNTAAMIDWHLDPVHGKRAPLDPWFKIPFLDFAVVGDHKVIWELNRHQHSGDAGQGASAERRREVHSRTDGAVAQLDQGESVSVGDQLGKHAGSCLPQLVVDLGGPVAGGSGRVCAEFRAELTPALAFHGRYIERYLSTYFSPNTHLLGEARCAVLSGHFVSANAGRRALEGIRMADCAA